MKFQLQDALLLLSSSTSPISQSCTFCVFRLACPTPGCLYFSSPTLCRSLINVTFSERTSLIFVVVVQLLSHVRLLANPWTAAHQASLSITISRSLLKLMSNEPVMPSNHLILCHPLLLLSSLISFRMDWLDLLAVQGTLKSFLQHHSSKASILWCSAFFIVQLSHPYMTTGKTTALTGRTFVDKVTSLKRLSD